MVSPVLDRKGRPDFQRLQQAFDGAGSRDIVYFAFDLLYLDGHDLRRVPLVERRGLLKQVLDAARLGEHVRYSETLAGPVDRLLADACKAGLEGIIGKRADSLYTSTRSSAWIKLKCTQRQEFVVGGYTERRAGERASAACSWACTTTRADSSTSARSARGSTRRCCARSTRS